MPLPPDDPRHGERRGYLAGCREDCCRAASNEYMADYSSDPEWRARQAKFNKVSRHHRHQLARQGIDHSMRPAQPVRDHVQALLDIGWTATALAAVHGGVSHGAISQLMRVGNETVQHKTSTLLDLPYTLNVPDRVPDGLKVPLLGVQRRFQALLALGWTNADMAAEGGSSVRLNLSAHRHISARNWRRANNVYLKLSSTPGPSDRTRNQARRLGYAAPAAWDNIDDPAERPSGLVTSARKPPAGFDESRVQRRMLGDRSVKLHKGEPVEVVRRMLAEGLSLNEIRRRTGLKPERYTASDGRAA